MILSIILFPIAILLTNIFKRIEKLDYFDYGISYNPIGVFAEHICGENRYITKNNTYERRNENYSNY